MQRAYLSRLLEIAEQNSNVLHLIADSGTGFDEMFRVKFPRQMMNFGIAEEHMVSAAAGMATAGKIPFVYTAGAFLVYRSLEFIRDDICFQNLNVKIVGMGSGLAWSSLGPTHHTTEDIAILRAIPNMRVLSPATPKQVMACVDEAYYYQGPVYIRIGMNNEREFFQEDYILPESGQDEFGKNGQVLLLCTGSILSDVIKATQILEMEGIPVDVIHVVRIKPFNEKMLLNKIVNVKFVVTVEEHNVFGGLGSIVSEVIAEHCLCVSLVRIGLNDEFAVGYGSSQEAIRKENQLDAVSISRKIKKVIQCE